MGINAPRSLGQRIAREKDRTLEFLCSDPISRIRLINIGFTQAVLMAMSLTPNSRLIAHAP
jgi:hypothetical protein